MIAQHGTHHEIVRSRVSGALGCRDEDVDARATGGEACTCYGEHQFHLAALVCRSGAFRER